MRVPDHLGAKLAFCTVRSPPLGPNGDARIKKRVTVARSADETLSYSRMYATIGPLELRASMSSRGRFLAMREGWCSDIDDKISSCQKKFGRQ